MAIQDGELIRKAQVTQKHACLLWSDSRNRSNQTTPHDTWVRCGVNATRQLKIDACLVDGSHCRSQLSSLRVREPVLHAASTNLDCCLQDCCDCCFIKRICGTNGEDPTGMQLGCERRRKLPFHLAAQYAFRDLEANLLDVRVDDWSAAEECLGIRTQPKHRPF